MRIQEATFVTVAAATLLSASGVAAEDNVSAGIKCVCVLATTGCQLKIGDDLAGNQRQEWSQQMSYQASNPPSQSMLNLACWRKRDVAKLGDGLCCSNTGDERDAETLFKGSLP